MTLLLGIGIVLLLYGIFNDRDGAGSVGLFLLLIWLILYAIKS